MNAINFQPNSNIRKIQQQQQILLNYKLKQNEMNRIQNQLRNQQQKPPINNDISNDISNDVINNNDNNNNNENSQKLAAIKSKIMSDYSNLYRTK